MKVLRGDWLFLAVLWTICLAVYLKTLAPSILYVDAGTMVAAAYSLGIPNPPGFPTYVMVSNLFTKIPWGIVLFRVQLLSIISALGVLTMVYLSVKRLILTDFYFVKEAREDRDLNLGLHLRGVSLNPVQAGISALAASLSLAFSYQFWSQTLNSEAYIFTNLLMATLLYLVLTVPDSGKKLTKRVVLGAAVLGIASGANPTIVQVVPALFLAGLFLWKRIGIKRAVLAGFITIIVTVLVYSFLPLRASQYPFLNWGNPQTWDLFWGHLKGEGLNIYDPRTNSINGFTGSAAVFSQSVGRYLYLLTIQFTPLLLPLIGAGIFYLFQKNKRLLAVLLLVPLVNLIFGGLYLSGNQESWFISSYVIFAILLGIGLSLGMKILIASRVKIVESGKRYLYFTPLVLALIPFLWWFPKLDRSSHITTTEYMDNLYSKLPKESVLIGSGDFFNSMSNYQYLVMGKKDVFPITANMWYILPWYRDNLRHQRPDLIPLELEGMIKKDRLEEYNEVLNWYIKWLLDRGHPVFVTRMVFRESVLAGTDAGKFVVDQKKLKAVESGLILRILDARDLLAPQEESFNYQFKDPRFYQKKPFYLERNYKAAYNLLLSEYGIGLASLADYYAGQKQKDKAAELIRKAYDFAPFSAEVVNRMAIFAAQEGDLKGAIRLFQETVQLDPASFEVRLNLAKALAGAGQEEEAKKWLEGIISQTTNPQIKDEALGEMAKLTMNNLSRSVPEAWKTFIFERKELETTPILSGGREFIFEKPAFEFKYPDNWQISRKNDLIMLAAKEDNYTIQILGGILGLETAEDWAKKHPLKFTGTIQNKGLAQIPGFEAQALLWLEEDGQKALEFILVRDKYIFHIKAGPSDSKLMGAFDQIISTIKFND